MGRKLGDNYYNEDKMRLKIAEDTAKTAGGFGFVAGAAVGLVIGCLLGRGDIEFNKYIEDIKGNTQIESDLNTEIDSEMEM